MIICKSWEQQVLENTEAIKKQQEADLPEQVSELNQQMARTLKIPVVPVYEIRLVSIQGSDQQMLIVGNGLTVSNGILSVSGSGDWKKGSITLTDLADSFYLDVTDAEAPIIIGIEAENAFYSATMTNNAQTSYPHAFSTLFYGWGTICCIESADGECHIIDASTGQTPPNSGGATIEYWYK